MEGVHFPLLPIRSVVRLYRIEISSDVRGDGIDTALAQQRGHIAIKENREAGRVSESQRGDETYAVVEGGTHLMHSLADNDTQIVRRHVINSGSDQVSKLIIPRVALSVWHNRIAIRPLTNSCLDFLDVRPCVLHPETKGFGFVSWIHGVSYLYDEGQQNAYSEDAQGPRDTRANKGRRAQGAEKSGGTNHTTQA